MKKYLIIIYMLFQILTIAQNRETVELEIVDLIEEIDSMPKVITFKNKFNVNNKGGHLQGIQYYQYNQGDYYFLSGSSSTYSYLSILKNDESKNVLSITKILDEPFKHAGGFQIYKNLMAIGVEDNSERDKSKVFIYRINNPEKSPLERITIIERVGTEKRATAGCVGIIEISDYMLVVVGDWDTEHLDFYRIERKKLGVDGETFELVYSINVEKLDKSEWINDSWLPYQNINFIKDSSDNLYLAGMSLNDNEENILDLFRIETEDFSLFNLIKVHTKRFIKNEETNFNWGAGVYLTDNNQLKVFSCGAHIQKESRIYIFEE